MATHSPSPFTTPDPKLRIKPGAPAVSRPTKEEVERFPAEAAGMIDATWKAQSALLSEQKYDLDKIRGKHFLLAGATGPGLGGAFASVLLHTMKDEGSLTVIGRDLKKSQGFETGQRMQQIAEERGIGSRFHWSNGGLALEGPGLEEILGVLRNAGAKEVVYVNTVAAANSGILPGHPPVYVKDVDEEGLFQWELEPLTEKNIESTKFIMGEMAVKFGEVLEQNGIGVSVTAFADWRGSLDRTSREPANPEYGRNGAYSTSLYLPKDYLQEAAARAYGTKSRVIDFFFPIMRTRALGFIPGGVTMSHVYDELMRREGIRRVEVPELALGALQEMGRAAAGESYHPFKRLDAHEEPLDLWFFEVVKRLNENKSSDFYYKHWFDV